MKFYTAMSIYVSIIKWHPYPIGGWTPTLKTIIRLSWVCYIVYGWIHHWVLHSLEYLFCFAELYSLDPFKVMNNSNYVGVLWIKENNICICRALLTRTLTLEPHTACSTYTILFEYKRITTHLRLNLCTYTYTQTISHPIKIITYP